MCVSRSLSHPNSRTLTLAARIELFLFPSFICFLSTVCFLSPFLHSVGPPLFRLPAPHSRAPLPRPSPSPLSPPPSTFSGAKTSERACRCIFGSLPLFLWVTWWRTGLPVLSVLGGSTLAVLIGGAVCLFTFGARTPFFVAPGQRGQPDYKKFDCDDY